MTLVDIPGHPRLRARCGVGRTVSPCCAAPRLALHQLLQLHTPALLPPPHPHPTPSTGPRFDAHVERARGVVFVVDSVDFMPRKAEAAE